MELQKIRAELFETEAKRRCSEFEKEMELFDWNHDGVEKDQTTKEIEKKTIISQQVEIEAKEKRNSNVEIGKEERIVDSKKEESNQKVEEFELEKLRIEQCNVETSSEKMLSIGRRFKSIQPIMQIYWADPSFKSMTRRW